MNLTQIEFRRFSNFDDLAHSDQKGGDNFNGSQMSKNGMLKLIHDLFTITAIQKVL